MDYQPETGELNFPLPPLWAGSQLPAGIDIEFSRSVNPKATGLIHSIQFATRYAELYDAETGEEIVLSKRAILCGIIEEGISNPNAYRSSNWLVQWLEGWSDLNALLRQHENATKISEALTRQARVIPSRSIRKVLPIARDFAVRTVGRKQIDLRHLLIAIIDDPGESFDFIKPRRPVRRDLVELKIEIARNVIASPEPSERMDEWQLVLDEAIRELGINAAEGTGQSQSSISTGDAVSSGAAQVHVGKKIPKRSEDDDRLPTQTDNPAAEDMLGRDIFALVLSRRIRQLQEEARKDGASRRAFMIHIHGRWGSGKSSFLHFLKSHLEKNSGGGRPSRVVSFNAWEHASRRPPWWAFLSKVYSGILVGQPKASPLPIGVAMRIRMRWWAWRLRSEVVPIVSIVIFAGLAIQIVGFDSAAKVASVVVAAAAGVYAVGRSMVFGSKSASEAYSKLVDNPLAPVVDLFNGIAGELDRRDRPLVVLIDDLDRCDADYLVELLEGIQNFFKGSPVTYVAAADRDWICNAFEKRYCDFAPRVGEPARPLGYLFLEKLFQISAGMPRLTEETKARYLSSLTEGGGEREAAVTEQDRSEARQVVAGLVTEEDIQRAVKKAEGGTTGELLAVREAAALQMTTPKAEAATENRLRKLLHLMEPNPRAMKLLVNEVAMGQARGILEGRMIEAEARARWAILSLRWPLLADYLAENPTRISHWREGGHPFLEDLPEAFKLLASSPSVAATIGETGEHGALDEGMVRQLIY